MSQFSWAELAIKLNKLGLRCAKLSLASANLHTSFKLRPALTDHEAITALPVLALKDLKTASLGGWWSTITLVIRLSQPQAGDWAWAWAELGKKCAKNFGCTIYFETANS